MARKVAIVLAIVMLAIVAWGLFFEAGSTSIIINGHELIGPLQGAIGAAGLIIGLTALFCAAIFLLFVFAGIGIFILGVVILAGLFMAGFAFPFLLVLLLPLAIVWLFIAVTRKTGA
ncbi:MAG TPA: hypothetical protein VMV70_05820 [Gallionella sp.]|nr:hypothetical protein [Gallionella sp.]